MTSVWPTSSSMLFRFAADGHRFGDATRRHLQIDDKRLANEQIDVVPLRRPEALKLRGNLVRADARGNAIDASLIGDGHEAIAGRLVENRHGDARKHSAGRISNRACQYGFLCECNNRDHQYESSQK